MERRVALVGEALVDFLGEGGEALEQARLFRPAPGGAPANAAVAAAQAGAAAAFAGRVGEDAFGRLLRCTLEGAGVDCGALHMDRQRFTTLAFVLPAATGAHGFQFMRGADAALCAEDLSPTLFSGLRALGCGGVSLSAPTSAEATLGAMRQAAAAGALVLFDVNWRPRLWQSPPEAATAFRNAIAFCDVVKCNEAELELLAGPEGSALQRARRLLASDTGGPTVAVVTLGEKGALWVTRRMACLHPGFAVQAVDAIGAGDCFTGNLLAWWARRDEAGPVDGLWAEQAGEVLALCNAAAALSTLRPGAMGAMPDLKETQALLAERGASAPAQVL